MQIIDHYSARVGAVRLAFMQFVATLALSFFVAWLIEDWDPMMLDDAWVAVIYAGIYFCGDCFYFAGNRA